MVEPWFVVDIPNESIDKQCRPELIVRNLKRFRCKREHKQGNDTLIFFTRVVSMFPCVIWLMMPTVG